MAIDESKSMNEMGWEFCACCVFFCFFWFACVVMRLLFFQRARFQWSAVQEQTLQKINKMLPGVLGNFTRTSGGSVFFAKLTFATSIILLHESINFISHYN
jgi:hypothetical protein